MRIFALLLLFGLQVSAQETIFNKGVVMDSISVNDSLNESFSLYLPTEFNGTTALPVIFIFDPEGNGRKAAQLFKPAAEQQSFILASSNNMAPNKNLEENVMMASRLINKVVSIIPVEYSLISVAGLSEGAKVATSIPLIYENIFGAIAVGDQHLNFEILDRDNKFSFVGIVGNEQSNFYWMKSAGAVLERMDYPSVVYTFSGGKEWPNPEIISSAVGFLNLQAMEKNMKPKNEQIIEDLYEDDLGRANALISNQKYVKADNFIELLQKKYEGLKNISEIKDKQSNLRRSRNYNDQQDDYDEARVKEIQLIDDYIYYFDQDVATANFENLGWWDFQKVELREYTESQNGAEAAMGNRLLDLLDLLATAKLEELEAADATLEPKLMANMLQTIFDQTNFKAYKNIIYLSAIDSDFNTAFFYLEEMLKNGYKDRESLYSIEGTLGLRLTPEYNWLIEKYLGSSKYYDIEN